MASKKDNPSKCVVVAGAGKAGLIAALGLVLKGCKQKIYIVDPAPGCGGSYSSYRAPSGGLFDRGIHLIPDITTSPFTEFLKPENGFDDEFWHLKSYPRRDRSGVIVDGEVHDASSLLSADYFPKEIADKIRSEFHTCEPLPMDDCGSVDEFVVRNFGPTFGNCVAPYIEGTFGQKPENLACSALIFVPLVRLIVHELPQTLELMKDDAFRHRIGFPDQRDVPPEFRGARNCYYPKNSGVGQYIDLIVDYLAKHGVEFCLTSQIEQLTCGQDDVIEQCRIMSKDKGEIVVNCSSVIWTAPLFFLGGLLEGSDMDGSWLPASNPPQRMLNFLHVTTDKPIFDTDAFYFYEFSADSLFRITNYTAFTDHSLENAYTFEVLADVKDGAVTTEAGLEIVRNSLQKMGRSDVAVCDVWIDYLRVPMPNFSLNNQVTADVKISSPYSNLNLFGSSAGQTFQLSIHLYDAAVELADKLLSD